VSIGLNKVLLIGTVIAKTDCGADGLRLIVQTYSEVNGTVDHSVVLPDKLAAAVGKYVTVGRLVYIEGRLTSRTDGGILVREVAARRLDLLGPRPAEV